MRAWRGRRRRAPIIAATDGGRGENRSGHLTNDASPRNFRRDPATATGTGGPELARAEAPLGFDRGPIGFGFDPVPPSMPRILFADYDFPDVELERALFAAAGVELVLAQSKTEEAVIAAARDCEGILLQYAPITERVVAALPGVGIVSRIGAGYDTVDVEACAQRGIWVSNSPDYGVGVCREAT